MTISLLFVVAISLLQIISAQRLIELRPNVRQWMQNEEILALKQKNVNFFDVTEHQYEETFDLSTPMTTPAIPSNPRHKSLVRSLFPGILEQNLNNTITAMSSFYNRYFNISLGLQAATWVQGAFRKIIYESKRADIEVSLFQHKFPQPSVITRIQGTGKGKDEIVILGAHLDSINQKDPFHGRAPGADDDASGVALTMEVLRMLAVTGFVPNRTIEIHSYAAEEGGLLGSQDIAAAYRKEGKIVAGMLQLDQAAYLTPNLTHPVLGVLRDYVNPLLADFLSTCIDAYSNLPWKNATCGYACTDMASWTKYGFPSCHESEGVPLFNNTSPRSHTPDDKLHYLSMPHCKQLTQVALGWVMEMSYDL